MKVKNTETIWHGKKDGWSIMIQLEDESVYEVSGFQYYKEAMQEENSILECGFDINEYDRNFVNIF